MIERPAPGPQLSAGRLRVDAARAIAKLREYQLANRAAWVLEAIRAAVASRATEIALRGDANDLWLSWRCEPWPATDLPRLFDELVSPEATGERYHVRLLAAAVNSALGLEPAFIDVFAIDDGKAVRARYTPDVLDVPEGETIGVETALRKVTVEPATSPVQTQHGMAIHFRRRFGTDVLSYALFEQPPELVAARAACGDISIPLQIEDDVFDRARSVHDVVREPLGSGIDGFVAVIDPERARGFPAFVVAERGVVLATSKLDLGVGMAHQNIPLRVFIDAPRMPTNASRSLVRHDEHPLPTATRRAREVLPALIQRLVSALAIGESAERARRAALALLAVTEIPDATLAAPLRALADLPLVRDATGRPRAASALRHATLAHTGRQPLSSELSPWLGNMLWIPPGDATALLVDPETIDSKGTRRHVRAARRQQRARDKFLRHAQREAKVATREPVLVRVPLGVAVESSCIPDAVFSSLSGEVCIFEHGRTSELVVLFGGRELERVQFDGAIPFAAVIEAGEVTPRFDFRGIVRDAEYARVEQAMRAGVLRAIESLACSLDHGRTGGHLPLFRAATALLLELRVPVAGPLARVPLWHCADETWRSLDQLRADPVIGTVTSRAEAVLPEGRVVVVTGESGRRQLIALAPATIVIDYACGTTWRPVSERLLESGEAVLVIEEPGRTIAVAASEQPRYALYHVGTRLVDLAYSPKLAPCSIYVDSDTAVPSPDWSGVRAADLTDHDLERWELALVRAAASALVGSRAPELLGDKPITLADRLGSALIAALGKSNPSELLGPELAKRFVKEQLFRAHGELAGISAEELVKRWPSEIPYVSELEQPLPGFAPLVASESLATAVGRLTGRKVRDATADLALRRETALRAQKLAEHRTKPEQEIALATGEVGVPYESRRAKGVAGVAASGVFELHILVEQRPFQIVRRADEPPLHVVANVPADRIGKGFEIPEIELRMLIADARSCVKPLVIEIAKKQAELLADRGPARALLAGVVAAGKLDRNTREELATRIPFLTLRKRRHVVSRSGRLAVASWEDEWLDPQPGEPSDELDSAVVQVPVGDSELRAILEALHTGPVIDVQDAIVRQQSRRRVARGLVPAPTISNVPAEVKRKLADLGELARELGPGEIALADEPTASAMLYVQGRLHTQTALPGVMPPVRIAIEAPELVLELTRGTVITAQTPAVPDVSGLSASDQLRALAVGRVEPDLAVLDRGRGPLIPKAQALVAKLVEQILAATPLEKLSPWVRKSLRRAVLASSLHTQLGDQPLFESNDGGWKTWNMVRAQIAAKGDLWTIPIARLGVKPLDADRIVIVLDPEERMIASAHGHKIIDASNELELDRVARQNRNKPLAKSLALPPSAPVLATVALAGDGVTSPRGTIGLLPARYAEQRGLLAHREMFPFERSSDVCYWPSIAVVDDARFVPDRVWGLPMINQGGWEDIVKAIRVASEQAMHALVRPPEDALAHWPITRALQGSVSELRFTDRQIRGTLWLAGGPGPSEITYHCATGTAQLRPSGDLGLGGELHVLSSNAPEVGLGALCVEAYKRMLTELGSRRERRDAALAHLAFGLGTRRIPPEQALHARFECFRPRPLDARELVELLGAIHRVPIIDDGVATENISIVDDGSALAQVILNQLGPRARRERPLPMPAIPTPAKPAPPRREPHPLDVVVEALRTRLALAGIPVASFGIAPHKAAPMLELDDKLLVLAADHPRLRAIAAACVASTASADDAIAALTAHALTVLNVALTSITDPAEAAALGVLLAET